MHRIDDRAIEPPDSKFTRDDSIHREGKSRILRHVTKALIGLRHNANAVPLKKVEAIAKVKDSTHDKRLNNPVTTYLAVTLHEPRPLHRSLRIVFPKINTAPEPVVIVLAGAQIRLSSEYTLSDFSIAAVVSENE